MFNIGPQELLLILLVALVVVGPKRLPELSRTIGRGLREFRKAQDEVKKTINLSLDEREPTTTARRPTAASRAAPSTPEPADVDDTTDAADDARPSPDTKADVARTLGRGLAEIRHARREIQRTFRVDLTDEPPTRRPAPRTPPATSTPAGTAPDADDASAGPETPA